MSANLKPRLQRRDGLTDAYLSSVWERNHRGGGAALPRQIQSAIQSSRTLRQSRMPDVRSDLHGGGNILELATVWQSIAYALWWRVYLERKNRRA